MVYGFSLIELFLFNVYEYQWVVDSTPRMILNISKFRLLVGIYHIIFWMYDKSESEEIHFTICIICASVSGLVISVQFSLRAYTFHTSLAWNMNGALFFFLRVPVAHHMHEIYNKTTLSGVTDLSRQDNKVWCKNPISDKKKKKHKKTESK